MKSASAPAERLVSSRLRQLCEQWRQDCVVLRRCNCTREVTFLERLTTEVEEALAEEDGEPVPLAEAARISGYSISQLRRLIAKKTIPKAGTGKRIAIARGDLPMKPGHRVSPEEAVKAVSSLRRPAVVR